MTTYTVSLAPRLPHSKDLFWEIVDHLESWNCFPDRPAQMVVRLCPRGLTMARKIDKRGLGLTLWYLYRWNPAWRIYFVGKEAA